MVTEKDKSYSLSLLEQSVVLDALHCYRAQVVRAQRAAKNADIRSIYGKDLLTIEHVTRKVAA